LGFGFVHLCLYLLLYIFLNFNVEAFFSIFLFSVNSFHVFYDDYEWSQIDPKKKQFFFIENGLTHNFQVKYRIFHDNFICYDIPHCM